MVRRWYALSLLSLVVAAVAAVCWVRAQEQESEPSDLIVHEWGTFLSMQGSDGVTLDGMYHEEHALPEFVHARSRDQLRLPSVVLKGETPVIYFYTHQKQQVQVTVSFPSGIWTQWYPQAGIVSPGLAAAASPPQLRDGRITWCAEVVPALAGEPAPVLPATAQDALWNYARDVDAAWVRTVDRSLKPAPTEHERFIFYRGLGQATLPLTMTTTEGGSLVSSADPDVVLRHVFIVRVENGRGVYRYLSEIAPGQCVHDVVPSLADSAPLSAFTETIAADLVARLTESGLYPKEARAMVNTWRESYFGVDGLRVLYVLPQVWTDRFIPMTISPAPRQAVRVMVGRLEALTPERERRAEDAINELVSSDAGLRGRAFEYLRQQGRYVEPIVRRVLRTTQDENVRLACQRLLTADFVTELRSSIGSPATGARVFENPLHVRAQLASLLREIGLPDEARSEAKAVLEGLRKLPEPMHEDKARHYFRAYARAMEGLGDDEQAAQWYGRFIDFASQVSRGGSCVGCHAFSGGPRDLQSLRTWWAGDKFAQQARRLNRVDTLIAEYEAQVARDATNTAARMKLAYLYAARGDDAESLWRTPPTDATRDPLAATE